MDDFYNSDKEIEYYPSWERTLHQNIIETYVDLEIEEIKVISEWDNKLMIA